MYTCILRYSISVCQHIYINNYFSYYFYRSPALEVYLIMRNIAVSLWYTDNTQLVTTGRCMEYVRLRGTIRIWISCQYDRVIHFLSRRAYINCGILSLPRPLASIQPVKKVYLWCICAYRDRLLYTI